MAARASPGATSEACFIGNRKKDFGETPLNRLLKKQKALDIQGFTFALSRKRGANRLFKIFIRSGAMVVAAPDV